MSKIKAGQEVELEVASLAFGGSGIARLDGFVVFVKGALPGDRVVARVTKSRHDYADAICVRVLRPSAERVPDQCVHVGRSCPGAPWQGLRYDRQLAIKEHQVTDALERLGRLGDHEVEPIVAAEDVWRYRNKLEYSFGAVDGRLVCGFHRRGEWRYVDDVDDCLLATELSNSIRNAVRDWCAAEGLSAYDRGARTGFLRNLVVREGRRTEEAQVRLVTGLGDFDSERFSHDLTAKFPPIVSLFWSVNAGAAEVAHGGDDRLLMGREWLEEKLAGLRLRFSADSFFQTNTVMAERLVALVAEYAGLSGREKLFDLYCGIGTIGLALSGKAHEVWGVDVVEEAIGCAIENARLNRIGNARFFCGNARTAVRPLIERAGQSDVVIVDPPRAGLSKKVVRRVLETGAERIVYVSCNPTTLASNARQIVDAGYRLIRVRPVDMFPHTPHIECVALFDRR